MVQQDRNVVFSLGIIKQSRPSVKSRVIELHEYPKDEKLCVVKTIACFLERTAQLRGLETKFFITYAKPYHAASADTLRRWIKTCMEQANVNTSVFSAHSTRAASTSAALKGGLPVKEILEKAGWSNETTFANHYKVPIIHSNKASKFVEAVFDS